jgi:nitrous oxidase accessory protein NosD
VVGGGTITSLVSTNGFSYGRIDGLSLVISGADTVCFNLSWDNTGSVALNANVFSDILTANATTGILIGLGGFMGSENVFINCTHSAHSHAGIKVINYNALANTIIGGGANGCDYGIYAAAGSFSTIAGASFAGNITADIHHISGDSVCISGCRSESNNFLQNDGHVSIAGCHHVAAGAGFFASFVAGSLVIDGCYSLVGTILGSSGKLYIRGSDFGNASYLTGYSGTVSQNI